MDMKKKTKKKSYAEGGNILKELIDSDEYMREFKQPITQEDVVDAELATVNEQAKSPYQQTKPELVQDELQQEAQTTPVGQALQDREPTAKTPQVDPMLLKYKDAISNYEKQLNAPKKEYGVMDALPDILTGLYNVGARAKGNVIPDMKMPNSIQNLKAQEEASRKEKTTGLQNLQNMYSKYLEMQNKNKPTFEDKEYTKARIKDEMLTKKENRKLRQETERSVSKLDEQIQKVKQAKKLIEKAAKSKSFGDTGPIDQYTNKLTDKGQKIEQAINAVSLDTMTKMFEGMSKAIDSDAERAFFQASQPSVGKYPQANIDILNGMLKNLESLKGKNKRLVNEISQSGERKESSSQVNEVKRRTKDGKTAIFNADTKEFLRYE